MMPFITCSEPGCNRQIEYEDGDFEVPLYCCKHYSDDGRHSGTKALKPIGMASTTQATFGD
jgi:hypothetical protein